MIAIDLNYTTSFLLSLLNTPSPTGDTDNAVNLVEAEFKKLGIVTARTPKGALLATFPGTQNSPPRALSGHVDTLGGMVKEIKPNGRLKISNLGSYYPGSIAGEYCTVHTDSGDNIGGTVLLAKQSAHIHRVDEIHQSAKNLTNLEVRLDARTTSKIETEALGVQVGDFISWDPRAQLSTTGFIKSRHLDDKAGVAAMLAAAQAMVVHGRTPAYTTHFYISTYEEVGHGAASSIPATVDELLVVDMGVVGAGQASDEFSVTICAKDGSGPYNLPLRRKLVSLAKNANIPCQVDVFVNYSSDGSAALRAGLDARVALIGPGVDSSHAYERTHQDALLHTAQLIVEYLQAE